jgi:COMPASS component SPP1
MFVQTEKATGSGDSKYFTVPMALAPKDPSVPVPQVESVLPDSLTSAVQNSPVILPSPPTSNVHNMGTAEVVKPPLPPPFPDEHETNTTPAVQHTQSSPTISRASLPPPEDVLNLQSSEQEIYPPPTTASPSPRALSPTVSDFQDGIHANQPVGDRVSPVPGTCTDALVTQSQNPVETPSTSIERPDAVDPPVANPPTTEAIHHAVSDSAPGTDASSIPIINAIKSEPTPEFNVAMDSKLDQVDEQNHADMDVDEELLSLIADDLPARSSQIMIRKHGSSSPENKVLPSHHDPVKQESAHGTLTPSCPSRAPSPSTINPERVSKPPPDLAISIHDPETSTLKPEERPTQKKKVIQSVSDLFVTDPYKAKQHAQPKSRAKSSGSAKAKIKMPFDGSSTTPLKSKKASTAVTKRSTVTARSRSTSVMPGSTTPAPGALPSALIEAEPDDAEEGMEDKLYCVCKTKYDDERVMIACDRFVAANCWVSICSYSLYSCDEWYHTSCVNMPDLEVDLVDQFICPICVESAYPRYSLTFY